MYLRSLLSDKPAAEINPNGPSNNPATNQVELSGPLSKATDEAKNPEKTHKRITTTTAINI